MTTATDDKPEAAKKAAALLRPRDAATLIIVDRTGPAPRVLMGKRRMEQVFMPGVYVFPGGRVDKTDRLAASVDELAADDVQKLLCEMKGSVSPARARALALAAIRETFEEAGLVIGAAGAPPPQAADIAGWSAFFGTGHVPQLSSLRFFARAITPPGRTRRYDTRFFYTDAEAIALRTDIMDGELSGLHWITVDDARDMALPTITRVVLEDLIDHISAHGMHAPAARVPYYHHFRGSFRRDLLPREPSKP